MAVRIALCLAVTAAGVTHIATHTKRPTHLPAASAPFASDSLPHVSRSYTSGRRPLPARSASPLPRRQRHLTLIHDWDAVAACESGGDWHINTGNGFYGGLQFTLSTWHSFGGSGLPSQASRTEQIRIAERVLAVQGWNAWPVCSWKAGVR